MPGMEEETLKQQIETLKTELYNADKEKLEIKQNEQTAKIELARFIRDIGGNNNWEEFKKECSEISMYNKKFITFSKWFCIIAIVIYVVMHFFIISKPCPAVDCSLCDKECPTEPCPPPVPCPPCPVANQPVFEPVLFDYNAYDIKHYFIDKAKRVIEYLKENPDKAVILYGNTDDKGNISYNKQLAERRVNSVKKYFVQQGIESGRIRTKTFGEHKSSQSNETQSGRLKNRRVEFEIKDYPWQD